MSRARESEVTLAFCVQIRRGGYVMSDYWIRGQEVELISYFPSGRIHAHSHMSLEHFCQKVKEIKDGRSAANRRAPDKGDD